LIGFLNPAATGDKLGRVMLNISDFIVPKWKHSKPEVRLKAVRAMDEKAADLIAKIGKTDPDSGVRVAAVEKITDMELLNDIFLTDPEDVVRHSAEKRLNPMVRDMIADTPDPSARGRILDRLNDQDSLMWIAGEINNQDIRLEILDRIDEPRHLCMIAESNWGMKAGLAVVERLSDPERLEQVARQGSNKKIRKLAETRRQAILAELNPPSADEIRTRDLEALCHKMENLIQSEPPDGRHALAAELEQSWKAIDPEKNHELRRQFDAAGKALEEESIRLKKERTVRAECEHLCASIEKMLAPFDDDADRFMQLQDDRRQVDSACVPEAVYRKFAARFDEAVDAYERTLDRVLKDRELHRNNIERLRECCVKIEQLATADAPDSAVPDFAVPDFDGSGALPDQLIQTCQEAWQDAWFKSPETATLKQRFDRAIETIEQKQAARRAAVEQKRRELYERLIALCELIERAHAAENLFNVEADVKAAQQEWKKKSPLLSEVGKELSPRFRDACNLYFEKLSEFRTNRDWERWANLNQKKALCEAAEKLAEEDLLSTSGGPAKKIRDIQARWKEIGPVSRDQSDEIWNRFRKACDRVLIPCMEVKTELYNQIKELADSENWQETTPKIKAMQNLWKEIGPLPRAMEKDLQRSFQEVCDSFFTRQRAFYQQLDEARRENFKQKRRLCEEAEALSESADFKSTLSRIKELQARWKEIGPIPRSKGDALWKRFRSACDRFFNHLDEERLTNLRKKELLCEQVETLVESIRLDAADTATNTAADTKDTEDTEDAEDTGDAENRDSDDNEKISKIRNNIIDLQKEWKIIGPVPKESDTAIWERFRKPCDAFFNRFEDHFAAVQDQQTQNQTLKEELLAEARQLSESTEWKAARTRLIELQAEWKKIGPAPRKYNQKLWNDFRAACDTFFNRSKRFYEEMDQERANNLNQKLDICLHMELLAKVVLDKSEIPYNQNVPMAEQLNIALDYKDEIVVPGDSRTTRQKASNKFRVFQEKWKAIGPVPKKDDKELWERYRKASKICSGF
jgi:DNA polymerase III psi subunit